MRRVAKGFSLIEVMIVVAIIGILTAIAVPQYRDYVVRTRLSDAFVALAGVQPAAEQYWANGRTFVGFDNPSRLPADTANFKFTLSSASVSSYTVTATGINQTAGFVYTINQSGARATTAAPAGWGTSASCWVDHKGGSCSL